MLLILYVIALALTVGGVWALAWGIPMIVLERGWAWVISGSMYLTGGAIVFGLAMVVRALRQLPDMLEAGYAEEHAPAPAGEAAERKARSAPQRAAPARPAPAPQAAPNADAGPVAMPDATTPAAPVTPAPAVGVKPAPAAGQNATPATGAAPVTPPERAAASRPAAAPAAPVMPVAQATTSATHATPAAPAAPSPQPASPEPSPPAPAAAAAAAAPAAPKAEPVIPAAVEGRLNDLLRPGSLVSASRPASGVGSDRDAAAPATPARPAPMRATPQPQPQPAARPGSLAGALASAHASSLAGPKAPASLKAPAVPPETSAPVSAPPPLAASGIAPGRGAAPDAAKEPRVLPAAPAIDAPARAPVSPDLSTLARDLPGQAAGQKARDATPAHPQGASASPMAQAAVEAKSDIASRIGSLFSRRGARADDASGKGAFAGKPAEKPAGDGGRLPPVFPERPAPRPGAAVHPELPVRPAPPEPAFSGPAKPAVAAPAAPAKTATGDVVFPTRPAPLPPAGGDGPAPRPAVAPDAARSAGPVAKPEPAVQTLPAEPAGPPTVVGSYTAAGALYVMYSDGSIEAQTESGVVHFPSLDALKAHVARGDKA